jgi:hypothetical protein
MCTPKSLISHSSSTSLTLTTLGPWSATRRPLTYSMNELAITAIYPVNKFPTNTFAAASEYFRSLASENKTHFWAQRNIFGSPAEARDRYFSRRLYAQSVDKHCISDCGPFKIFSDDFRPQNIIVDPATRRIKAILISSSPTTCLASMLPSRSDDCCW